MMDKSDKDDGMKRLRKVIDAYGGAPGCWPEAERAVLEELVRTSEEARRWQEEAVILDRLLALSAPNETEQDDAATADRKLAATILARLDTAPAREADIIPFMPRRNGQPAPRRAVWRTGLPAAAVLAASLLIGVWVGLSGKAERFVSAPLEVAGLDLAYQPDFTAGYPDAGELGALEGLQ